MDGRDLSMQSFRQVDEGNLKKTIHTLKYGPNTRGNGFPNLSTRELMEELHKKMYILINICGESIL